MKCCAYCQFHAYHYVGRATGVDTGVPSDSCHVNIHICTYCVDIKVIDKLIWELICKGEEMVEKKNINICTYCVDIKVIDKLIWELICKEEMVEKKNIHVTIKTSRCHNCLIMERGHDLVEDTP